MLRRLFDRESPFAAVPQANPLFRSEARQVTWGASPARLWSSSLLAVLVVIAVLVVLWLVVLLVVMATDPNFIANYPAYINHDANLWSLIGALLIAFTLLDTPLLAMIGLWNGLNTFNDDMTAGRWDLLRLSPVPPEEVINARYASTQLRTWRVLMIVVGTRMGLVLIAALTLIVPPLLFPGWRGILSSFNNSDPSMPLIFISLIPAALLWSVVFVAEPLWRLRLIAAGSIALAVRMRPLPIMILYGIVRMIVIAFLEGIVVVFTAASVLAIGIVFLIPLLGGIVAALMALLEAYIIRSFYGGQIRQWRIHTVKQMHILWELPFMPVPDSSVRSRTPQG
ncbi:MAG: hypothetical protein H7175_14435 [Burkholderiales bacterium]|nr:hypothetical protein [Anaerolineae bacterium]